MINYIILTIALGVFIMCAIEFRRSERAYLETLHTATDATIIDTARRRHDGVCINTFAILFLSLFALGLCYFIAKGLLLS